MSQIRVRLIIAVCCLSVPLGCRPADVDGAVEDDDGGGSGGSEDSGGSSGTTMTGGSGSPAQGGSAGEGGGGQGGTGGVGGTSVMGTGGGAGGVGGDGAPAGSVPMFVAVGRGGRRIMSCDRGRTWVANQFVSTQDGEHSTFTPKGLAYGNGTFVFLSGWGNPSTTWITTNGVDWVEQKHQTGFAGLGYDDGQFVLVGTNYHEGSKDNGKTWTRLPQSKASGGREGAAFTGIWAAGTDGQAQVLRKGMNSWANISGCTGPRHGGIGADGGFAASTDTLISVGSNGNICGVNIATGAAIGATQFNVEVRGKPNFAAGSFMVATGDSIRFSKDGSNWTTRTLPKDVRIDLVDCDADGHCVGLNLDGKSFYYSDDAMTWSRAAAPQGNGMVAVKAGAGLPSDLCKLP
ncbi:MAG: hypothetical protein SF187_12140 [Deltaproteobacteria bacterium]|nr:hypothetical protein [Deltaproteobacteria bacterium]